MLSFFCSKEPLRLGGPLCAPHVIRSNGCMYESQLTPTTLTLVGSIS